MGMVSSRHSPERLYTDLEREKVEVRNSQQTPAHFLSHTPFGAFTNSPVELVEVILSHQPEVGPEEKQKEWSA